MGAWSHLEHDEMRVVQVCPYDIHRHGGVQRHIRSLTSALMDEGYETIIVSPNVSSKAGTRGFVPLGRGRQISIAGTRFELTYASAAELESVGRQIRDWRADVVHYHTILSPIMPYQLFRVLGLPSVGTFHATPPTGFSGVLMKTFGKGLAAYVANRLDGVIGVSASALAAIGEGRGLASAKIIPPVTDLSTFAAPRSSRRVGAKGALSILVYGRLEPRKGIDTLLNAWASVEERLTLESVYRVPQLTIAGGGPLEGAVRKAASAKTANPPRYVPAPKPEELDALMAETDVVIAPAGYGESFGIVLAEAMAAGLPVLAADNAGYRDVLSGPLSSNLFSRMNAAELAQRIWDLCELSPGDPFFAHERYRSVAMQYDVTHWIDAFRVTYEDAVVRRRNLMALP